MYPRQARIALERLSLGFPVFATTSGLQAVDIKSGSTFAADRTDGLKKWQKFTGDTPTLKPILIYGGMDSHEREHCLLTG